MWKPTGQILHAPASASATEAWNRPASHSVQLSMDVAAAPPPNRPGGHDPHVVPLIWPISSDHFPASQGLQPSASLDSPLFSLYLPMGHLTHESEAFVAPGFSPNVPAGHGSHTFVRISSAKVPTGHGSHCCTSAEFEK